MRMGTLRIDAAIDRTAGELFSAPDRGLGEYRSVDHQTAIGAGVRDSVALSFNPTFESDGALRADFCLDAPEGERGKRRATECRTSSARCWMVCLGFSWVSQGMMTIPIQERLASLVPTRFPPLGCGYSDLGRRIEIQECRPASAIRRIMRANGFDDFEGLAKIALKLANELRFECAEIDAQQWNAQAAAIAFAVRLLPQPGTPTSSAPFGAGNPYARAFAL